MSNSPVISLKGYKINKLSYNCYSSDESESLGESTTEVKCGLTSDFTNGQIILSNRFIDTENNREISVELIGYFEISKNLTDEEKIQEFLSINGTAILYPYLRSIISVVTSLDSENVLLLPTVNILDMLSETDSEKHS